MWTDVNYFFAQAANLKTNFSAQYASESFENYTVADHPAGLVKNAGTFSFLRVYGAGHEVTHA